VASLERVEELTDLSLDEKATKLDVRYTAEGTLWKMGDMFQLSVELYDTKDKKVVWSDRWQEKWDNLPSIKGSLSDGLLKALDTKPKVEQKIDTTNSEAYEFYLKAKHKYEKRENTDDTEIARGLYRKAIELDDNLIVAKVLLGWTYTKTGDYDKAMGIYTPALKQAEKIDDKVGMRYGLNSIGVVHYYKGNYDKALDYYGRSRAILEEIGDKRGMGAILGNIGSVYSDKGDFGIALDYYERSLAIKEELGDKCGIGNILNNIGIVYGNKGDVGTALDYLERSLEIKEELGDKGGMGSVLNNIGLACLEKGDYEKALDYYDRSLRIAEELDAKHLMGTTLSGIGHMHWNKGDLDTALDYYERSLAIAEELGDKRGMGRSLLSIGHMHWNKGDYEKALEYLEKSLSIQKEIGLGEGSLMLETTTYLYITYKHLGKAYDVAEIHSLIKEAEKIDFELNYHLYEFLDDITYIKTAHNQVQELADNLEPDVAAKFLGYSIPKAILEEWEKVK
jgi:tetratricopeptide (TPR) repeat protein